MSESALPLIELEEVRLALGGKEVLRGVNLRAMPRERLVILGASGSGKSTLLRIILGILTPSAGDVRFCGRALSSMSRRELNEMRARIGMVYQYSALVSSLSVRENLALPLEELTETPRGRIEEIIAEKLALVGMREAARLLPDQLSGGMKKRVALARALVLDPTLILYDEPSAGLDPIMSGVIDELIISLSEKIDATSLIVTHEMGSAFRIATRMAMLHEGEIILEDAPERFRESREPVVVRFLNRTQP